MKRRRVNSTGEKERYTHLSAEFQRIARRDKKAFLSDQCKEIEEKNRMGKTRDLFKKIREKKKKEYTELYKEDLHNPDNHNVVITHLEPDILECEVKWAL